MTFNLSKETPKFNLTKEVLSKKFLVAINWGKNNIKSAHKCDVDLMAIAKRHNIYDNYSKCYFNRKTAYDGALYLTRDDRSGERGEEIYVDFSKFPDSISEVIIFITFYSNRHDINHIFNNLDGFELSVTDLTNNKVVVKSNDVKLSGVTHEIIKFVKVDNEWNLELINKSVGDVDFSTYTNKLQVGDNIERFDYYPTETPKKGFIARLFGL